MSSLKSFRPYSDSKRERDADAEAAIRRGEGISHEEILPRVRCMI